MNDTTHVDMRALQLEPFHIRGAIEYIALDCLSRNGSDLGKAIDEMRGDLDDLIDELNDNLTRGVDEHGACTYCGHESDDPGAQHPASSDLCRTLVDDHAVARGALGRLEAMERVNRIVASKPAAIATVAHIMTLGHRSGDWYTIAQMLLDIDRAAPKQTRDEMQLERLEKFEKLMQALDEEEDTDD